MRSRSQNSTARKSSDTGIQEGNKQIRNSSFELLRILSMFCIVSCHFATHGKFDFDTNTVTLPRLWWYFLEMGGNFGVNVFVLVSGYFLITAKGELLNLKRILKFWGQVFFYSVLIYSAFGLFRTSGFSSTPITNIIFPITFRQWWFASTYFVLYLLHPFINRFLNGLNMKEYQSFLVLLLGIWCVIPTISREAFQSNSLLWFITLYCVAAYIRLYGLTPKLRPKHCIYLWLLTSFLRYLTSVQIVVTRSGQSFDQEDALSLYATQSIFTFLSALFFFMMFKNLKIGYHKWINVIASATFGVYLIHDHPIIRSFLWQTVFKNASYQESALIVPYSIGAACLVYSVCTVIDLLRQATVEKAYLSVVNNKAESISKPFRLVIESFKRLAFGEQSK